MCGARRMVTTSFSVGSGIGPETLRAVALSGLDDLLCGLVDQLVIIRLQANANLLCVCHCGISSSYVCHTLK